MKVLVINNDGGGFANHVEIEAGTQLGDWVTQFLGDRSPNDYLIRVNRLPAAADQILCEGDRISVTPVKIEGASETTTSSSQEEKPVPFVSSRSH